MEDWLNKVHCMDCLEGLKQLPDNSIDLIVTDPPYNIGKDFDNDNLSKREYLQWCSLWICELERVLKWGGSMYICLGFQYVAEIKCFLEEMNHIRLKNWIVWYRQDGWKTDKGFSQSHEHILFFVKDVRDEVEVKLFRVWLNNHRKKKRLSLSDINNKLGWAITGGGCASGYMGDKEDKQIPSPKHYEKLKELLDLDNSFDRLIFNFKFNKTDVCDDVWLKPKSEKNRVGHPTQKPVPLFRRMIKASSNKEDIVLDPFLGSGTTAVACKQLSRRFIGFEISPEYCEIAEKRINSTQGIKEGLKRFS